MPSKHPPLSLYEYLAHPRYPFEPLWICSKSKVPLYASMNMQHIQGAPLCVYEYVAHPRCYVNSSTFPPINLKNWTEHSDRQFKLRHLANHYGWATKNNHLLVVTLLHGIANMGSVEQVFVFFFSNSREERWKKLHKKRPRCPLIYVTSGYPWPSDTVTYDITFSSINNITNSIYNKTT